MDYARQQRDPTRHAIGITFVVLVHVLVIWAMLAGLGRKMDVVIELKVNDEILLDRVKQRIAQGLSRADDNPETLKNRLAVYHRNTAPLIAFYGTQGKVVTVDGMAPIPEVTRQIAAALDKAEKKGG